VERRARILLVDDDATFLTIHRLVLQGRGFEVKSASSGHEGLALATEWKPDLIVMDVMMETETEGFHVTYELRQNPELRDVPILMVTAINQQGYPSGFKPDPTWLPVDQLLDKPVEPDRLVAEVNRLLGVKSACPR
jgi:CheY-like chemotaxis protein